MSVILGIVLFAIGGAVGWLFASRRRARPVGPGDGETDAAKHPDAVNVNAIVDGVPVPAMAVDRSGRVVHVNEIVERDLPALRRGIDPGEVSASLSEIIRRALGGETVTTRERVSLGDPARSLRVTVVRYDGGAIVSLYDVTEDVDFEEARRTFSAAVSHELRTPLARILGLAETLALPDLEDERTSLVLQIEHEVEGIRKLIDEMLLLAALDRGRLAVADGVVDAAGVTRRIVEEARQRRIGRGHLIHVDAPGEIDVPVAARLYEVVVQNLVDNALIHSGEGSEVSVGLHRQGEDVVLTVVDTGIGIPPQHLPFVFQRFYRGDASRTGSGTGLGLALVKHIVEAHGGSVSAESEEGSGTTMRVTLPLLD